jgi:hypothetical protein
MRARWSGHRPCLESLSARSRIHGSAEGGCGDHPCWPAKRNLAAPTQFPGQSARSVLRESGAPDGSSERFTGWYRGGPPGFCVDFGYRWRRTSRVPAIAKSEEENFGCIGAPTFTVPSRAARCGAVGDIEPVSALSAELSQVRQRSNQTASLNGSSRGRC